MHRVIQDHLEEVLAGLNPQATAHLSECEECREEISLMRSHAAMLQSFRAEEMSPRPGFYARVMDRIEARKPIDIFQLFFESVLGRRVAVASMSLAFLFSIYLVSSERLEQQPLTVAAEPQTMISDSGLPDKDTVLVNLVTYREP
jgi:predicted anti-sigma-YlaC factor YlaD